MWVILSKNINVCIHIAGQTIAVLNKYVDALYISENLDEIFDF